MATGAFTPTFQIYKGGENITAGFHNRALSIKVELQSGNGGQDTCTIIADDRDWALAAPHVGDVIEVSLGYEEVGLALMGSFELDEVTFIGPPRVIQIHGNSMGFSSAAKAPQVKNFEGKTVKDLVEWAAQQLGVQAVVDQDIGSKQVPYRNNTVSPMHLLGQLEREFGAVFKIGQGRLSFAGRDSGITASGQEIPLVVLRPEHLGSWEVRHLNRSDYSSVSARYRDRDSNKEETVQSKSKVGGVLGQGEGGSNRDYPIGTLFPSKEQAQSAADSTMKRLDANLGEGLFTLAQGDPWVRDQNRILVIGTRDGIDGSYVSDIVAHSYSKDSGLTTSIRTQAPGDGSDFAPLYEAAPDAALAPAPGQVVGNVLPKQGDPANSNPAAPPPSTAPDPRITAQ
ncbi:phage late control D family protein [Methylobacterium sp. NPDC080182]|uniref:phage late control D family protein n=1 Tax=Methylobacterium sp. NPDC080182 TaxID=3390590 RepID=UPI003D02BAC4